VAGNGNGAREFSPRGPVEIANFLNGKATELSSLQAEVQEAHEQAEDAEIAWMEHFDSVMEDLDEELEKLPGEEKCIGIARRRGGWARWAEWRRAERRVKRLEKVATLIDNQISASQSEAKLLKAVEA
jgi:hypothetical protein